MDRWGLIGREAELAHLQELFATAARGRGGLATVVGEPGIGKTRLAETLALSIGADGHAVAWGRAWEAGGAPPLLPWQEVATAAGFPWPDASPGDGYGEFRLYDSVTNGIARASAELGPLLIILEDLHIADAATLRLLSYLSRRLPTMRVVVVATWREVEARRATAVDATLSSLRPDVHVRLGPLDRSEHDRLLLQGRHTPIPEDTLSEAFARGGGVPLHAKEVLSLIEAGSSRAPDTVAKTTSQRTSTISDGARHLLDIAAMVGREFDPAVVAAAAQVAVDRALSLIGEGVAAGILERGPGAGFRFTHALVRDAIDDSLDPAARAAGHLAVAVALEKQANTPSSTIAHHYLEAAPVVGDNAVSDWAARAAREARSALAFDLALHFATVAVEHMPADCAPALQAELMCERGTARVAIGDLEGAKDDLRIAFAAARRAQSAPLTARAALGIASAAGMGAFIGESATTDPERASVLRVALDAQPPGDSPERVELAARLGAELWGDFDAGKEREALLDEAIAMADRLGDPRLMARARVADFIIRTYRNGPEHLSTCVQDVEALAVQSGDLDVTAGVHYLRFISALARGDVAAARHALVAHGALASRYDIPIEQWRYRTHRVTLDLISGSLSDVEEAIEDAFAFSAGNAPPMTSMVVYVTQRAMVLRRRASRADLAELEKLMLDSSVALPALTSPLVGAAFSAYWQGNDDVARDRARAALDASERLSPGTNWLVTTAMAAELMSAIGEEDLCHKLRASLAPWTGWAAEVGTGLDVMGPVDRALALLNARLGDWAEAERLLTAARQFDTRTGNWGSQCLTELWWADVLNRWGTPADRDRALVSLERAEQIAAANGAPAFAEDAIARIRGTSQSSAYRRETPEAVTACLRFRDGVWVVQLDASSARIDRGRGMSELAALVASPGREFHVLELAGAAVEQQDLGPQVDQAARSAYLRRAEELRDQLAAAERDADLGRIDKIRDELEFIAAEISGAVGRHGRPRPSGATAERARVATTKALRAAITRIGEQFPELGGHLQTAVRTGTYCRYEPDPTAPVTWTVET